MGNCLKAHFRSTFLKNKTIIANATGCKVYIELRSDKKTVKSTSLGVNGEGVTVQASFGEKHNKSLEGLDPGKAQAVDRTSAIEYLTVYNANPDSPDSIDTVPIISSRQILANKSYIITNSGVLVRQKTGSDNLFLDREGRNHLANITHVANANIPEIFIRMTEAEVQLQPSDLAKDLARVSSQMEMGFWKAVKVQEYVRLIRTPHRAAFLTVVVMENDQPVIACSNVKVEPDRSIIVARLAGQVFTREQKFGYGNLFLSDNCTDYRKTTHIANAAREPLYVQMSSSQLTEKGLEGDDAAWARIEPKGFLRHARTDGADFLTIATKGKDTNKYDLIWDSVKIDADVSYVVAAGPEGEKPTVVKQKYGNRNLFLDEHDTDHSSRDSD